MTEVAAAAKVIEACPECETPCYVERHKLHKHYVPVAGLDAAWADAEVALPEGGRLHLQRRAEAAPEVQPNGEVWIARQGRAAGAYEAWATTSAKSLGFAYDDTPVAALRALTERLRSAR